MRTLASCACDLNKKLVLIEKITECDKLRQFISERLLKLVSNIELQFA